MYFLSLGLEERSDGMLFSFFMRSIMVGFDF